MQNPILLAGSRFAQAVFFGLLLALAHELSAANYYFSALGNDAIGNGSLASPWKTIGKFNTLDLNPGDSAYFRPAIRSTASYISTRTTPVSTTPPGR